MSENYPSLTVLGNKVLEPRRDLETFPNPHPGEKVLITLQSKEFTCRCPVTGQPDFAKIIVEYVPAEKIVESKSFKLFLWSFRDEAAFHEKVIGDIADFFMEKVRPYMVEVTGVFNPRGGIKITVATERTQVDERAVKLREEIKEALQSLRGVVSAEVDPLSGGKLQ